MRLFVALTAVAALIVPAPALGWSWPVNGPVLTLFSFDESHPYDAGQHRGIDIGAPPGVEVTAPTSGSVAFAGTVPHQGKTVTIETTDGYSVTLVHLGSYAVGRGEAVAEGEVVGAVGPTGDDEMPVPYVHLGVRRTADEQGYVDPLSLLPVVEASPTPQPPPSETPAPPRSTPSMAPATAAASVSPPAVAGTPRAGPTRADVAHSTTPSGERRGTRPAESRAAPRGSGARASALTRSVRHRPPAPAAGVTRASRAEMVVHVRGARVRRPHEFGRPAAVAVASHGRRGGRSPAVLLAFCLLAALVPATAAAAFMRRRSRATAVGETARIIDPD